jgi:hypothetical protein
VHGAGAVLTHELGLRLAVADHDRDPGVEVLEELVGQRHLVAAVVQQRDETDVGSCQER